MRKEYANWQEYNLKNTNMNSNINRHDRRTAKVKVNGKEKSILKFLTERAADLPLMADRKTGEAIDHVKNLRDVYMSHGKDGVNEYISRCHAVIQRDTSPKFLTRLKGWLKIKWFQIRGTK